MKIQVDYEKSVDKIEATITVIDNEDYLTTRIFYDNEVCLDNTEVNENMKSYVMRITDTKENIQARVDDIINRIRTFFENWRNIQLPEDNIYVI